MAAAERRNEEVKEVEDEVGGILQTRDKNNMLPGCSPFSKVGP